MRQVSQTTLIALLVGRWHHDRSEGFAFFISAWANNVEDRTRDLWIRSRQHSPCGKIEFYRQSSLPSVNLKILIMAIPEDVTGVSRLHWQKKAKLAKNMISSRNPREGCRIDLEISRRLSKGPPKQRSSQFR
ncbi:hypothetical protein TNCV_1888491 [Trichonephila clavipes]|nr:hypothetical protein TNCV_1888491 [Trichonephila clavipes]